MFYQGISDVVIPSCHDRSIINNNNNHNNLHQNKWGNKIRFSLFFILYILLILLPYNVVTATKSSSSSLSSSSTHSTQKKHIQQQQHRTTTTIRNKNDDITTIQNLIRQQQYRSNPILYHFRKYILHHEIQSISSIPQKRNNQRRNVYYNKQQQQQNKSKRKYGTIVSLQFPTKERVVQWYTNTNDNIIQHIKNLQPQEPQEETIIRRRYLNNNINSEDDDCDHSHTITGISTTTIQNHIAKTSSNLFNTNTKNKYQHLINHAMAGMTNPTIQYYNNYNNNLNKRIDSSSKATTTSIQDDTQNDFDSDQDKKWWPPVSSMLHSSSSNTLHNQKKNKWRIIKYRKTIGYGYECYQSCRDAILQWEFNNTITNTDIANNHNNKNKFSLPKLHWYRHQGIVTIPEENNKNRYESRHTSSSTSTSQARRVPEKFRQQQQQQRYLQTLPVSTTTNHHHHYQQEQETKPKQSDDTFLNTAQQFSWGLGKQMVTYTSTPSLRISSSNTNNNNKILNVLNRYILQKLPKLYVINPVMVLYNIVDQCSGSDTSSTITTTTNQQQLDSNSIQNVNYSPSLSNAGTTTYTCTAYGTQNGHWLCGEERITICYRHPTTTVASSSTSSITSSSSLSSPLKDMGCVDVEIISYSKPSKQSLIGQLVYPFIRPLQQSFFRSHTDYIQTIANNTTTK